MRETQCVKHCREVLADGHVVHRRTAVEAGRHKERLWAAELRRRSGLLRGKQQVCFDKAMSTSHGNFPHAKLRVRHSHVELLASGRGGGWCKQRRRKLI
jgi:hypothetical protein